MSTQLLVKKLNKDVKNLESSIKEIKKFLYAPIEDSEGDYKKSFVKKMLARAQNGGTFYRFMDKESFLKHVNSKK